MNLEQIVKETVAKIVAEKKGKDLTGDGKIDSADYLKARSNAIEKAKNLDEDYEVAMAQDSLDSIIRAAMMLKTQMGDQEVNLPAWIQDHITNSENYINQAAKGYHESDAQMDANAGAEEMDEARFKKGEDVGGKGFEFKDIAKKAAKQYGSKEAGQRVAGAVMKKVLNKEEASTPFKQGEAAHANRKHYTSNPYSVGSKEHDDFYNGWMNAETANQMAHDEFMFRKERGMDETRDPNSESDTPYYAVFDFYSKQQFYIIAKSASEMLSRLNGYIKAKSETNPEYKFSYDMENLQDDYYNGKLMPSVISDDFATVTKNAEEFKQELSRFPNAIEYKGSQELDEWTIRRMQHYAGIK
jgi:hypothetical protein